MAVVRVLLFARAAELCGASSIVVELPDGSRVVDLREQLMRRHPALEPIAARLLIAVGREYVRDNERLNPNAEIACFPPVSGG